VGGIILKFVQVFMNLKIE